MSAFHQTLPFPISEADADSGRSASAQLLPLKVRMALPESGRYRRGMSEQLFTVLCEFRGGTYVSQVHARDEQNAFIAWAGVIRRDRPMGDEADHIATEVVNATEPLNALNGLSGVWCWTAHVEGHFLLTNIVRSG